MIVVKESVEEIAGREAKSTLEKGGKHHNLICIRCGEVFTSGRTLLQQGTIWEKVICNELMNLTFICNGHFEQMRV
jgi:Fe2+ or Zn2+ uptake regulation protein